MKIRVAIVFAAVAAMAAGPAAAELFGHKIKPEDMQAKPRSYGVPAPPAYGAPAAPRPAAAAPRPPSMPAPGGFKPHEPYKGSSVYGAPRAATPGAKPCEISVYTNACRQ